MGKLYTEDKKVIKNHVSQAAIRLMKASENTGSTEMVQKCLEVGNWLDNQETEAKPEPKKRTEKKNK